MDFTDDLWRNGVMGAYAGPDISESGLVLALDAGNPKSYPGTGTTWTDLSGNGRNFTWSSTPTFTSDGVKSYFSTLNKRCTGPASNSFGINNTSGYTIFLVSMQNALTPSFAFNFYNTQYDNLGRGILASCTYNDDIIYFDQGGCCGSDTRTSVASGGAQTWNIWTFRRLSGSSTRSISKNSITLTTNTATAANIDLSSTAVDLGSGNSETSSTWNARLNSFYVYNRGLSDAEIAQNYNALKGRYGLS